jgi:hypothetical protein
MSWIHIFTGLFEQGDEMKRKHVMISSVIALLALGLFVFQAAAQNDIARLRKATLSFRVLKAAQAAGYDLVPGLDYCFSNEGVGDMGFHYINTGLMDTTVELLKPEAMVYMPDGSGRLKLGAVEYIVPAADWDATGSPELPQLLGRSFHLNEKLQVYVLHAWIWKNNPSGMFEDWNPKVACP